MTHLPFIVAAYGVALGLPALLGAATWLRLRRVRRALAVLETSGELPS